VTNSSQPVVLITGASSGLGRATAELLAANGYRVFGTSRTSQADQRLPYSMLQLDVHSDAAAQACVQEVLAQAGHIDVLINNAGFALIGASEETALDQVKDIFETNFFGAVRMVNAVLPAMRRASSGTIINISSMAGLLASPFIGFYCASKHALEGYSEGLRYEVKPFGIRVALVEPGFFQSGFAAATQEAAQPVGAYAAMRERANGFYARLNAAGNEPQRVAQLILRILRQPRPRLRYLIGLDARLFALSKRAAPMSLLEAQARLVFRLDDRPLPEMLLTGLLGLLGVGRTPGVPAPKR
jgi:NAD(P)-dependent dehydrogenase (short-subunit alcohol dehydrogenase family)